MGIRQEYQRRPRPIVTNGVGRISDRWSGSNANVLTWINAHRYKLEAKSGLPV
jgi:hypothetical protein